MRLDSLRDFSACFVARIAGFWPTKPLMRTPHSAQDRVSNTPSQKASSSIRMRWHRASAR